MCLTINIILSSVLLRIAKMMGRDRNQSQKEVLNQRLSIQKPLIKPSQVHWSYTNPSCHIFLKQPTTRQKQNMTSSTKQISSACEPPTYPLTTLSLTILTCSSRSLFVENNEPLLLRCIVLHSRCPKSNYSIITEILLHHIKSQI